MAFKILITPRSFGKEDPKPYELLKEQGYEIVKNPFGRIMTEQEMMEAVKGVDAVILGVDPMNQKVIDAAGNLKVISKYGVGTDNIDVSYAQSKGIVVTKTVGANSDAVADYAFALMLAVARKVVLIDKECRKLNWGKISSIEMYNKKIGIVGLGNIGKGIAKRASGFNMKVYAFDVYKDENFVKENNIEFTSIDTIIKECDFISLHLPLTPETKDLISYDQFKAMKSTAIIVNTARGGVIDEEALLWALQNNEIYGAGIDVFEKEPPEQKQLLELDNIIIGSHCAASTVEAVNNMGIKASENVIANLK
jgi:D-3-phosphoglycerate dehydrogenase